jgi:hypothetical protein
MRQDVDVTDAESAERGHCTASCCSEADHDRAQPTAVVARRPDERERMQHRGVAGQLVVLVEDVQVEVPIAGPVVHGLEGDQRQPLIDSDLGDRGVLNAVWPAPEDLSFAHCLEIVRHGFGEHDDLPLREELLARLDSADQRPQLFV